MKSLLLLALLASGCVAADQPHEGATIRAHAQDVYEASGGEPTWSLAIDGREIVLRSSLGEGERRWHHSGPVRDGDVRVWQAGEGANAIRIEARSGFCEDDGEEFFEDEVVVSVEDYRFVGCGGAVIGVREPS